MASEGDGRLSSKLARMQMRYQQKAQQEQEQRRAAMKSPANALDSSPPTEAATSVRSANPSRLVGNGKVRQMFDERRRGAGIDRSQPLKPIAGSTYSVNGASTKGLRVPSIAGPARVLGKPGTTSPVQGRLTKGMSTPSLSVAQAAAVRSNNDRNNNNRKYTVSGRVVTNVNANGNNNANANANANRLKPIGGGVQSPTNAVTKRSVSTPSRKPGTVCRVSAGKALEPIERPASNRVVPKEKQFTPPAPKSPITRTTMSRPPPTAPTSSANRAKGPSAVNANANAPEGTQKCRYCGRSFNIDRLQKHEHVCERTMNTKRRIFDASKQRVKGTESEKYNKRQGSMARAQSTYSSAAQQMSLQTGVKKNNWRKKHEEFIKSIRAAKEVQAHLARGGKLSDLPPPPPSENPDYIQCPHCGRRFNQQAAERHIPRCATMVHNKPRRDGPPPLKKR